MWVVAMYRYNFFGWIVAFAPWKTNMVVWSKGLHCQVLGWWYPARNLLLYPFSKPQTKSCKPSWLEVSPGRTKFHPRQDRTVSSTPTQSLATSRLWSTLPTFVLNWRDFAPFLWEVSNPPPPTKIVKPWDETHPPGPRVDRPVTYLPWKETSAIRTWRNSCHANIVQGWGMSFLGKMMLSMQV